MTAQTGPTVTVNDGTSIPQSDHSSGTAFDHAFTSMAGDSLPLSRFAGNVLLVVNTASQCGFTRQYADLQALWQRYRDRGLVVLGVPSNDFGRQEPGTRREIEQFCSSNYGIDFPLTDKHVVSGRDAHPFYRLVRRELGVFAVPRWNFYKYLVGRDGKLITWFSSPTSPLSGKVTGAIEAALEMPNPQPVTSSVPASEPDR